MGTDRAGSDKILGVPLPCRPTEVTSEEIYRSSDPRMAQPARRMTPLKDLRAYRQRRLAGQPPGSGSALSLPDLGFYLLSDRTDNTGWRNDGLQVSRWFVGLVQVGESIWFGVATSWSVSQGEVKTSEK